MAKVIQFNYANLCELQGQYLSVLAIAEAINVNYSTTNCFRDGSHHTIMPTNVNCTGNSCPF